MKNDFSGKAIRDKYFYSKVIVHYDYIVFSNRNFLYRVFYLQILEHDEFDEAAFENKTYTVPVQPLRGRIIDRNGIVLTDNIATFDLITNPSEINDPIVFK